jgi:transcriptional regulator with XRE-family HTH domain
MAAKDPMLARLGGYLRKVRIKRGWSQEALAFKCGLHRTYIGSIERGEYNVTILSLRKITDTLKVSLVDSAKAMVDSGKRK